MMITPKTESGVFVNNNRNQRHHDGEFGADRYSGYDNSNWQWYNFYVGKEDKNGSQLFRLDWRNLTMLTKFYNFILKFRFGDIEVTVRGHHQQHDAPPEKCRR